MNEELNVTINYDYDERKLRNYFSSGLFKTKSETIHVYFNKYVTIVKDVKLCSQCNRREEEDVVNFLAVCPASAEFRVRYFGVLSRDDLGKYLNRVLSKFCKIAWIVDISIRFARDFNF